eukprot:TRINITY_DN25889_c0_g1_i1.p1 TRINITY_DN25889_c0_g1~~TRINITY_DN25889_c0_g1_i1.p1  ORF type:complete len:606 (-),score=145.56 TRINITY_DN25889_c0_g1_i1:62-1879(-)
MQPALVQPPVPLHLAAVSSSCGTSCRCATIESGNEQLQAACLEAGGVVHARGFWTAQSQGPALFAAASTVAIVCSRRRRRLVARSAADADDVSAADDQEAGTADPEFLTYKQKRWLETQLKGLSLRQLRKLSETHFEGRVTWAGQSRKVITEQLMSLKEEVYAALCPKDQSSQSRPFSTYALQLLKEQLLHGPAPRVDTATSKDAVAGGPANRSDGQAAGQSASEPLPVLLEVRHTDSASRKSFSSVAAGKEVQGRVSGVSRYEGLRIDLGLDVDALVPLNLSLAATGAELTSALPLGSEVTIRIQEVTTASDPERPTRFPLVASLVKPAEAAELAAKIQQQGELLRTHRLSIEDDSANAGSDAAASGSRPEVTVLRSLRQDASQLPPRPAPEVLLSLDASGAVRSVEVPAAVATAEASGSEAAVSAWQQLAQQELDMLALEQRCRDKLVADLEAVEKDLSAACIPSVPATLVGLTPCADANGLRYLQPYADGDCLRFRLVACQDAISWMHDVHVQFRNCWEIDSNDTAVPAELREAREQAATQFLSLFRCSDVRHERALRGSGGVQDIELENMVARTSKAELQTDDCLDFMTSNLAKEVAAWTS